MRKHEIVLWRILGSDLPPRHHQHQTRHNVSFILENERLPDDIGRRWLLNRIWDREAENNLIALLSSHDELVHRIPFDRDHYRQQFLDPSGLPAKFDPMSIASSGPRNIAELLALEWIYRRKNLAAIALNEARNVAIALGAKEARWVLPLDGSTFMSREAICELRELIRTNPDAHYLIIPMVRFFENDAALKENAKLGERDEPQIGFRNDSSERFDDRLRYGNMPKAELLIRLGVPGPWHRWPRTRWERSSQSLSLASGKFATGSWVARLSTGAHHRVDATVTNRFGNRILGIAKYCDTIDLALADEEHLRLSLHCYNQASLQGFSEGNLQRVARWLEMQRKSFDDPRNFADFANLITSLALAYRLGGGRTFAEKAADCARKWFFDLATRAEPKVGGETANDGRSIASSILQYSDLWSALDALRIINSANALSAMERQKVADWLRRFRDSLLASEIGKQAQMEANGVAVVHDLAVASLSAYLGDASVVVTILNRAPLRLHNHLEPSGAQSNQLSRERPLHERISDLQQWFNLAVFGKATGIIDLWRCGEIDRRSLARAVKFLWMHRTDFPEYFERPAEFESRIDLLVRLIPRTAVHYECLSDISPSHPSVQPIGAGNGIPPLWDLLTLANRSGGAAGQSVFSQRFL